jgi:hypothetical protein
MMTQSPHARNLAQSFRQRETRFQDRYNSDGELGPFSSVVDLEGVQDFKEDALPEFQDALDGSHLHASTIVMVAKEDTFLTDAAANDGAINGISIKLMSQTVITAELDVDKMKVTVLRDKLRKRELSASVHGIKSVLVEHLKQALADEIPVISHQANRKKVNAANKAKTKLLLRAQLNGFKVGTRWKVLVANSKAVAEPENPTFTCARAPTVPVDKAATVPVKHHFDERFARPPFMATYKTEESFVNGRLKYNRDGSNHKVKKMVERGCVNPLFVKNNNLTIESHPVEFVHGFFPFHGNRYLGKEYISIELITNWMKLKATLAGAGPGSTT